MSKRSNAIVRFAIEHRVTMAMAVLGITVLGWVSLYRLPLEFLPAFSSSSITVSAPYPSSSPQEIERLIVRPMEDALGTINGIENMTATATGSQGRVQLSFVDGTDMDMASVDVRDRIDRVRHLLPDDLERMTIRRFQTSDIPVIRFDMSADWPEARFFDFAEDVVQRRLERLEGVARVSIMGLRVPELQVNLDPARMQAHGVDVRELVSLMRSSNLNVSGGEIKEGSRKLLVRTLGEFTSPGEILRLPVNARGLRLRDVADVSYGLPEKEEFNFLNGVEAVTVSVNKASNENVLAVVDRIQAELDVIVDLPEAEGMQIRVYQDASRDVRKGLGQLRNAGLFGGLLAVAAMYLFLRRFRSTALIAVAIPVSVIATFALIYFLRQAGVLDLTLNVISLAGLMLALGMLVDNSVVVIESIFRYRNELGESPGSAALHGASEVALPIIASTATTLCVFVPIIFLGGGGRLKLYMENIGVMVCIVMVASLMVALTVVPMASVFFLGAQDKRSTPWIDRFTRFYGRVLGFTLRHRFLFVVTILAMFGGVVYLFSTIERSFSGRSLERHVRLKVDTPRQYTLEQTRVLYEDLYELLDSQREALDIADISHNYDRGSGRSRSSWRRIRQFDLFLKDEQESDLTTAQVGEKLKGILPVRAGVDLRLVASRGGSSMAGIEVQLMGEDQAILELLSRQVVAGLSALPGVKDVDTSLESGDQEIHVTVQPERALQAGLSSRAVAFTVNNALSSRAVSHYKTGDREVDLVMQYGQEDRESLDQLKNVPIVTSGSSLPLAAVANFEVVTGARSIERENHRAKVTVTASTTGAATFSAMRGVGEVMGAMTFPPGYEWSFGRWNRFMQRDQTSGLFALLFALPLVYMLMAALFESFAQPLTIMFSIPFALLGVGVAMKLAGQPWDTMTSLGLLVLIGVVVNNAIVLIDHINFLRSQGLDRHEAILRGGQNRLRPILITAVTTILGLTPMVAPFLFPQWFGPVEGRAATWAPIGLVIVGGLTTSTFLTLLIIPTIYSLVDDLSGFVRRVGRAI